MQLIRDDMSAFRGETVLTIGKFDGIHVAHQRLVQIIKERANNLGIKSGMVTFDPHPAEILKLQGAPPLLTPLPEKIALLEELGLDLLLLLTFNREMMQTRAADFLEQITTHLHPRELWVGHDFAMGYRREGNVTFIREWAEDRDLEVFTIPAVEIDGEPVSGSRIRALLAEGAVEQAGRLLGRPPAISGTVSEGDRRGQSIGFPTANLTPEPLRALPQNGVYATRTRLPTGEEVPGVTNVGIRPTFDGKQRQVETHLFDWSGTLYGQTITVSFLHHLREEQKFPGVDALIAQIRKDVAQAQAMLTAESQQLPPDTSP